MNGKERIRNIIQSEIEQNIIAGANILVIREDKIIYKECFGYSDIEQNKKMTIDSIFRLASLTKPITAFAILQLIEQGSLNLHDNVSKYIDSFANPLIEDQLGIRPANREVTIYDLLTMTSGVVYPEADSKAGLAMSKIFDQYISDYQNGHKKTSLEFIEEMGRCPLAFHPGQEWRYGASADVLGAVIEVVTGRTLGDYLKEAIFDPLEMVDTGFYIPKDKWDRQVTIYEESENHTSIQPYNGSHLALFDSKIKPTFESGGAGLVSTIKDYAKFATMLLHHGTYQGKQLLSKETFTQMKVNQLTKEQAIPMNWYSTKGCGYGYFVRVLMNQEEADLKASIGTYGWDGWTGPYFSIDEEKETIVLYFISKTNTGTNETTIQIHNEVYHL